MLCWLVVFIYLFVFFRFRLLQFIYYLYLRDFFSNYSSFVCSRFVRRCLTAAEAYLRSKGLGGALGAQTLHGGLNWCEMRTPLSAPALNGACCRCKT